MRVIIDRDHKNISIMKITKSSIICKLYSCSNLKQNILTLCNTIPLYKWSLLQFYNILLKKKKKKNTSNITNHKQPKLLLKVIYVSFLHPSPFFSFFFLNKSFKEDLFLKEQLKILRFFYFPLLLYLEGLLKYFNSVFL